MKDAKIKLVKSLIDTINKVPKDKINTKQEDFIKSLQAESLDSKILNGFLIEDAIYENTNLNKLENTLLTQKEWEEINNNPLQTESIGMDDSDESEIKFKNKRYYRVRLNKEAKDIELNMLKLDKPLPAEMYNFIQEIDKVQNTINELYSNDDEAIKNLKSLTGIAEVGGTSTYNALAVNHLNQFKQEITIRKGSELKGLYLKQYGINVCYVIVISFLIIGVLDFFQLDNLSVINSTYFMNSLFLIAGTSIGAWLIFAIKKREVSFEDLRVLKETKQAPVIRLVVINLIALTFFFMFLTDFMNFKIGNIFDTAEIKKITARNISFLIGLFFGLSESTIGAKLTSRVETFVTKL